MIINGIYGTQKSPAAVACSLPGFAKDLSAPLYVRFMIYVYFEVKTASLEMHFLLNFRFKISKR
jgi:hypothetical protein